MLAKRFRGRRLAAWTLQSVLLASLLGVPLAAQEPVQPHLVVDAEVGNGVKHRIGHPIPTPLRVAVRDENGSPVAGAVVVFELPENDKSPGGIFAGGGRSMTLTTDSNGVATVTPGVVGNNIPGEFTIRVTATSRDSKGVERSGRAAFIQSNILSMTSLNLKVLQGQGARSNVKSGRAVEPEVVVQDEQGEPVVGAEVTFTVMPFGAGGSFQPGGRALTVSSGEDGKAVAKGLRVQRPCGKLSIEVGASLAGLKSSSVLIAQEVQGCGSPKAAIAGVASVGVGAAVAAIALKGPKRIEVNDGPPPPPGTNVIISPGPPIFTVPGR